MKGGLRERPSTRAWVTLSREALTHARSSSLPLPRVLPLPLGGGLTDGVWSLTSTRRGVLVCPPRAPQESFPELGDVLFFARIFVAVIAGVASAALGLSGWMGFGPWLAALALVYVLHEHVLKVDSETFGSDFATDGLLPSWAAFVLVWILLRQGA